MSAKSEFLRVRRVIHNEGLATTIFYRNKSAFAGQENAAAYVYIEEKPPIIILKRNSETTYLDLILDLGHEYGHVIDFIKWKNSKRWKIFLVCPDDFILSHDVPKYVKKAMLQSELQAERYIPAFLQKFKVKVLVDKKLLEKNTYIQMATNKYELTYGVSPKGSLRKQWKHKFDQRPRKMTDKWLYNFDSFVL